MMKYIIATTILVLTTISLYGQLTDTGDKVGIGTSTPDYKLEVEEETSTNTTLQIRNTSTINGSGTSLRLYPSGYGNRPAKLSNIPDPFGANFIFNLRKADASFFDAMIIRGDGNVGIGTISPDSKLAINGTIHTKEVKVDLNGWSDFVFENEYELRALEDVEEHIEENGHLPEIPSEAEVTENGINLGEMNAKLLQKIEELTLYMIDINKEVKQVKYENQELKNEISALKNE